MGAAKMTHNRSFQAFMNKPIVGQLGPSTGHAGALNGNPAGETKSNLQNKRRRAYTEAEKAEFAVLRRENIALMKAQGIIDAAEEEAEAAKRQSTRRRYICPDDDDITPDDGFFADMNSEGGELSNGQRGTGQGTVSQRNAGGTPTYPF